MKTDVERSLPAIKQLKTVFPLIALLFITSASTGKARSFQPSQTKPDSIVGTWNLAYATDEAGGQRKGRGSITLVLKRADGKLTGTAYVTGRGGEKHEWKLSSPVFDGGKFTFAVDNGEGVLEGKMEMKEGGFEGTWKMRGTELNGSLKMTRKE